MTVEQMEPIELSLEKEHEMNTLDKIVQKAAIPLIALAGVILILAMISTAQNTNKENNAYIRVINYVVTLHSTHDSMPLAADIENCYAQVEQELDIKLKRYDSIK